MKEWNLACVSLSVALTLQGVIKAAREKEYHLFVSTPFNFQHNYHVTVDPAAPTGFQVRPRESLLSLRVSRSAPSQAKPTPSPPSFYFQPT